ncbi:DNA-binding response regulator [Polaribacter pacificus]|uniref:DNA-binding response regulator n=1 Tax=Polaribacter pacificus TaxID=1775173 RepID=A0A917HVZ2_9FLAO|nr:response regulator transcription factor [Polaribacter pacificus]GGG91247.1 DNA-binding response regulator [Polaribacter pacificus]
MTLKKIHIALADDEVLFRKGMAFLLEKQTDISVVFEANNGRELLDYLESTSKYPDIILMDLKMPLLNGIEATKQISHRYPEIKIVALTSYNSPSFIANVIDVGAASYLVKTSNPKDVLLVIHEIMDKGFYYDAEILKCLKEKPPTAIKTVLDADFLTERELEILSLICQQHSTKEIAEQLFLSKRTVEWHRNNLLIKTQSKNFAGLVVFAFKNQLVGINEGDL